MNKRIVTIVILTFLYAVVLATLWNFLIGEREEYVITEGVEAKITSFTLPDMDGEPYLVESQSDKPKIIHFWTSWCPYCSEEAPYLKELYDDYKDEVEFISINWTPRDSVSEAKAYIEQYQFEFPALLDENGAISTSFSVTGVPTNYFVQRDGTIQAVTHVLTRRNIRQLIEE